MDALMGIDLGTSSVKVLIIDENGNVRALAHANYPILTPHEGFAEQDPNQWWQATMTAIRKALEDVTIPASSIRCIGFSGQMHGTVLLDGNGQVIRPAIIHCDRRSAETVSSVYEKMGKRDFCAITKNALYPGFMAATLGWLQQHEPANYQKTKTVLLPKDYIRYKLTGRLGTDVTDASATLLFDNVRLGWSKVILHVMGIDPSILPECNVPTDIAGEVKKSAAMQTGLKTGTPVVFGGADQPMQALGNGLLEKGTATVTIGTGGQVLAVSDKPITNTKFNTHTFVHVQPNAFYVMGAMLSAGLCLDWFNRNILGNKEIEELIQKAQTVDATSEGLIFLPYLMGERTPHMDPNAKAMFYGLTIRHDWRHMVRAIMEGVAFALLDCYQTLSELGLPIHTVIASGGAVKNALWMQILADVFEKDLYMAEYMEHACTGAAMVAGVGCGLFSDLRHACERIVADKRRMIRHNPRYVQKYRAQHEIFKRMYKNDKRSMTGKSSIDDPTV